ncbi:MAG: hypothetical protein E7223_00435 [Clostridiales bacterium]|nr:hypothetical protein [Clostridiales bacterium]
MKECDFVDTAFLDAHFNLFDEWEINTILMIKQVDESFLEKYFCSLDPKKISRYQKFSESFFMHHFNQLDADLILKRGLNEWCAKENRSKQLDVFLRLKGVKL